MAKCPECGEGISVLARYEESQVKSIVSVEDGDYVTVTTYPPTILEGDGSLEFECPICNAVVAHSDEAAEHILKRE